MVKFLGLIACFFFLSFSLRMHSQNLFFSEFTPDGTRSVLEIFNSGDEPLDLNGYNVRLSFNGRVFPSDPLDNKYFDLSGYTVESRGTFIFAGKDAPEEAKLLANVVLDDGTNPGQYILHFYNDDALGLFIGDSLIDIIGKNGIQQVWDVAGVYAVTAHATNGAKTMIRKPFIYQGNINWDDARGYVEEDDLTLADSSEWLVYDKFFSNLKKHTFVSPDSAVIWSEWFEISVNGSGKDTIYFVPTNFSGNDLLQKISTFPGVRVEFFRNSSQLLVNEILEANDELVVWNVNNSQFHTYVIHIGNYNYLDESVIISEVLYGEMVRAIEVCNMASYPVDLTGWGIAKNDAGSEGAIDDYTSFPDGWILKPGETFVLGYIYDVSTSIPSTSVTTFADFVLPYFDKYEKGAANLNVLSKINFATSFTLRDNSGRVIDRFQPGTVAATIDGKTMAFNMATLIRRPYVNHGEPVWNSEKESQKESSGWTWKPYSYKDLGKHHFYPADTAFVNSGLYIVSAGGLNDSIFPLKKGLTCNEFLQNLETQNVWTLQVKKDGNPIRGDEVIPAGSVLEVTSTDLSFIKTYSLCFGSDNHSISSSGWDIIEDIIICRDLYSTSQDLLLQLTAPENGIIEVVNGLGYVKEGYLNVGDRIRVKAEDFSQKFYYIDFQFPSDYTLIRSSFYTIDTLPGTISGVPEGEDPELFIGNLIVAEGQEISIIKQDQLSDGIKTGDIIRIIASNGNARDYSVITYQPAISKQVWAEPSQTLLPPGLSRSDIYLRSLRHRTSVNYPGPVNPESGKPWETMDALNGFHCTQLRWVSGAGGPTDFVDMVQNAGFKYQYSVNPRGSLLTDDNYFEPAKGVVGDQCCPNKPGTAREYFAQLKKILEMGSEGLSFHSDGARWLMDGDISSVLICYCDYCNRKRSASGISNPASMEGKQFMLNSMLNLLDSVHTHFEDSLGQRIEWSANNGSPHSMNTMIQQGYTTPYGEVTANINYASPAKWINDFRTAEQNGKIQLFQICSKEIDNDSKSDDVLNVEQYDKFVCINRTHYAFAYAAGGLASIPWDSYTGTYQSRHFGLLSEFADLSGFIRGIGPLLDGYESGFDYFRSSGEYFGNSYVDQRFTEQNAPVEVEGNENAVVFVRVKPGDENAPILIHLTEWFHIYETNEYYVPYKFQTRKAYTLKIRKSAFFNDSPFSVKLLTPMPYREEIHRMSQAYSDALLIPGEYRSVKESAAYASLVREEYLETRVEGDFIIVQIPVLPQYGILKIEKGFTKPAILNTSRFQICDNTLYVPEMLTVESLLSSLHLSENAIMLVQDSLGFNKYSGTIKAGDKVAVLSANQTCTLYDLNYAESSFDFLLKNENRIIQSGEKMFLEKIPVDQNTGFSFTIINTNDIAISIAGIEVDNEFMQVQGDLGEIAPGDSGSFKIELNDPVPGKISATIKISTDKCNELPFHFDIHADVVAPDLVVRHQTTELGEGSILNLGSGGIGEELETKLTLINFGKVELNVSEILADNENINIISGNLQLQPTESADVMLRLKISDIFEQGGNISIRSNSYGPDSILNFNVTATGKAPLINVSEASNPLFPGDTLEFGEVKPGENETIELRILNKGNEMLDINRISQQSNRFSLSLKEAAIAAGEEIVLIVTYSPEIIEAFIDSVRIESNSYQNDDFILYIKAEALSSGIVGDQMGYRVKAYPNPFSDHLFLQNTSEFFQMRIISSSGKILRIVDLDSEDFYEMDTSDLEKGLYMILMIGDSKSRMLKVTRM